MAANDVNIRQANSDDVYSMLTLERECPTAAHWTEKHYRQLFAGQENRFDRLVLVAEEEEHTRFLGFMVARHVASEWELENIVVAPSARRKGLGKRLLDILLVRAAQTSSESVFLEVRESNIPARNFYENARFQPAGRRKSYYDNPLEDAIVYRHDLK
jgi:[ribosomal protein S18]-alanine N-acetyltransferase